MKKVKYISVNCDKTNIPCMNTQGFKPLDVIRVHERVLFICSMIFVIVVQNKYVLAYLNHCGKNKILNHKKQNHTTYIFCYIGSIYNLIEI